jgi:hypothetical protein
MSAIRLLSTSDGVYRYRLNGREESLPLRPNHYWNGEVGGGISSLSYPEVIGRNRRRITYVYGGRTWVGLYRREVDGQFALTSSYGVPS